MIDGTKVILDLECKAKCYNPGSGTNEVIPDGIYPIKSHGCDFCNLIIKNGKVILEKNYIIEKKMNKKIW